MTIIARLTDPLDQLESARLDALNRKISKAMTRMFRAPQNGGNPFLFALTAPKPHEIADTKKIFGFKPGAKNKDGSLRTGTAATNGRKFFWDPDFLEEITVEELTVVMLHEAYHVILYHPIRLKGSNHEVANTAFDYVVNACIEHDCEILGSSGSLWNGNIGKPLLLADLLEWIDGQDGIFDLNEKMVYADVSLFGRSPESIYAEIMSHMKASPRRCPTCHALSLDPKTKQPKGKGPCDDRPDCEHDGMCCPGCGTPLCEGSGDDSADVPGVGQNPGKDGPDSPDGDTKDGPGNPGGSGGDLPKSLDSHIDCDMTKQEIQQDTLRAAQHAKTMKGSTPDTVEDMLGELMNPTLKFTDLIRSSCMKKVQDAGFKNDWRRFRRRYIAAKPRQYLPKKYDYKPRWLAMIDTSGSMSQDDLTYGLSQLKALGTQSEGFIVPCDTEIHWDGVTPVKNVADISKTKIIGRGGTIFDGFFRDFSSKLGKEFDCIIVITDGECDQVPMDLKPRCPVVWVLTQSGSSYTPSFGRVAPLRTDRP